MGVLAGTKIFLFSVLVFQRQRLSIYRGDNLFNVRVGHCALRPKIPRIGTFSAASDNTSTLRSPAFASSMILLAIISSLRSRGHLMAARAISNATPRRRVVSRSKVWPCKKP
jgi:hypothetical protein